jgi:hypothetical protein
MKPYTVTFHDKVSQVSAPSPRHAAEYVTGQICWPTFRDEHTFQTSSGDEQVKVVPIEEHNKLAKQQS